MQAGFWRRLAAGWTDIFVAFVLTALVVSVAAVVHWHIAFEPMFVVVGAIYGAVMLSRRRQTIGKMLLGMAVTLQAGGAPRLLQILPREIVGKWGLTVVLPIILAREGMGAAWVPTIGDLLVMLLVLPLFLFSTLIARRAWYDQLAGTVVERVPVSSQRPWPAFAALLAAAALGASLKVIEYRTHGWIPSRLALYQSTRSTERYASFLRQPHATDVDYVLGLFERHDVVVLCERLHPEASQWDFIDRLVRDPRFIDRVGHVFTEYGQQGMQAYLDEFMSTDGLSADEVHQRVLHLMRHWAVWPVWTNTNFSSYLKRLYALNQSLPPAKRIRHHFTDVSIDWSQATAASYREYRQSLGNRDEQMARCVIEEMRRLAATARTPPKCLVVMNYRHAFDLTGREPAARRRNTYEFLKDAFGDRAANVLLNCWFITFAPVAGGVWDAAFAKTGNPRIGFDFAGSPFGEDPFDLFPFHWRLKGILKYRDVFTGFVFAQPVEEQYLQKGVAGYFAGFEQEALRRAAFVSEDYRRGVEAMIRAEQEGKGPSAQAAPCHLIESVVELTLFGLAGVGLLIGVAAFAIRRPRVAPVG